ncbi:hypothetical protein DL769_008610 [Monosporascus sp. CRB-8-3]|nr:hypothetical protein DL769_008610 [Monosporascus sp. CRB-8-3]
MRPPRGGANGFHPFGQSWGGYDTLIAQLPRDVRGTLEDCNRRGDYESEEFEKAAAVFYARHICRLDPRPEEVLCAFKNLKEDPAAYLTLQGPSEFVILGSFKNWEIGQEARKIEAETLILNGRYDEATDLCMEPWFSTIPKVKWVTLENSSHMGRWKERERYMEVVGSFLMS